MFNWLTDKFKDDRDETIEMLREKISLLESDLDLLVEEVGEIATYCDKCGEDSMDCFKCKGTGVIKRKQLFGWQWS